MGKIKGEIYIDDKSAKTVSQCAELLKEVF